MEQQLEHNQLVDTREATVLRIIADEFDIPLERLTPSVSLIRDLGADSLSLINIIMHVEEQLEIEVAEEEWRACITVGDVLTRIRTMPDPAIRVQP